MSGKRVWLILALLLISLFLHACSAENAEQNAIVAVQTFPVGEQTLSDLLESVGNDGQSAGSASSNVNWSSVKGQGGKYFVFSDVATKSGRYTFGFSYDAKKRTIGGLTPAGQAFLQTVDNPEQYLAQFKWAGITGFLDRVEYCDGKLKCILTAVMETDNPKNCKYLPPKTEERATCLQSFAVRYERYELCEEIDMDGSSAYTQCLLAFAAIEKDVTYCDKLPAVIAQNSCYPMFAEDSVGISECEGSTNNRFQTCYKNYYNEAYSKIRQENMNLGEIRDMLIQNILSSEGSSNIKGLN